MKSNVEPVSSGHPAIPRRLPLNTDSTVHYTTALVIFTGTKQSDGHIFYGNLALPNNFAANILIFSS